MRPQPFFLIACLLAGMSFAFGQNTYYVTQNGAGAKDGTGWADAFDGAAFRSFLKTANYGTVFWLAAGTYTPGNGRDSSFLVPSGVKVYGGFPASGNPTFADRNITGNQTILSGEIATSLITDNCYHVVQFKYADSTTLLDGLTITAGYASGNNANSYGGGIYNDGSYSSLVQSSPVIINCSFINNFASNYGGAMYNTANSSGRAFPKLTYCLFQNNSATFGGCLYNYAEASSGTCSIAAASCKFISNGATYGSVSYDFAEISGLVGSSYVNCLFTHNKASNGGTLYSRAGNGTSLPTIDNCTFSQDTSGNSTASLIFNQVGGSSSTSIVTVRNSIFWNNSAPYFYTYTPAVTSTSLNNITYSDIEGGYIGTGNIALDPLFLDRYNSDFHIASCSPCVNIGTATNAPVIDLDSVTRPVKGAYDMGAYESKDTGIIAANITLSVSPNDTFCSNVNAVFMATTNAATPAYHWQVNGIATGNSSSIYTSSALNTGDVISCKVMSTASCLSPNNAADSLTVFVKPAAIAGFTYAHIGNDYDFIDASSHASNIKWLFGDGDSSLASNPSHTYPGGSSYTAMQIAYNDCGSDTFSRMINLATGINEAMGQGISIYPNPATEKLYITLDACKPESVIIYDLTGQRFYEAEYKPVIDIKCLASGVYTIEVRTAEEVYRQKFTRL